MGTQHPRIGVTRDPELGAALEITRDLLGPDDVGSEAGHVRRLALVGARYLVQDTVHGRIARDRAVVLAQAGARAGSGSLDDLTWLDSDPVDEDRTATRLLDEIRGD
jgi:hypothetical protein